MIQQTIHDCLTEAMDIEGLEEIVGRIVRGEVELIARDLREPSPFSHEIINAKPYAFLDPAPLEERRTRAIRTRHVLDPATAKDLGKLDGVAVRMVREEAWPQVSEADELYDALVQCGLVTAEEGHRNGWGMFFEQLKQQGRVSVLSATSHEPRAASLSGSELEARGSKLAAQRGRISVHHSVRALTRLYPFFVVDRPTTDPPC